jgi:uncharacterized protein (DUF1778 family)
MEKRPTKAKAKYTRFEARLSPELKAAIETAADIRGVTTSAFAKTTLKQVAEGVIASPSAQVILLDAEAFARFEELIKSPPNYNDAMLKALEDVKRGQVVIGYKRTKRKEQP